MTAVSPDKPRLVTAMAWCSVLLLTLAYPLKTQPLPNGYNYGLAGSGALTMQGVWVLGWNPANLAGPSDSYATIAIPSLALKFGNNAFSPLYISRTFVKDKVLTDGDVDKMLSFVKQDHLRINAAAGVPLLGFSIGSYAFHILTLRGLANVSVPSDIFELVMRGWEVDKLYVFDDLDQEMLTYWETGLTAARVLEPPSFAGYLGVGATFKYLTGIQYYGLGRTEGHFMVTRQRFDTQGVFQYLTARHGDGVALDLGMVWNVPVWKTDFGFTVGNLIGSLLWTDVEASELTFEKVDGISADDLAKRDYWQNFFHDSSAVFDYGSRRTALPKYLLLSARRDDFIREGFANLYFSWYQGLNQAPGHSTTPRVSVGSDFWPDGALPLRTGFSVGGVEGFELGGGLGFKLGRVRIDVGMSWQRGVIWGAKGFSFGLSSWYGGTREDYGKRRIRTGPPGYPWE